MNKKLLSFIVPVYNAEKYLEECLDSLVAQNIPLNEYEIICIDDGSTDQSRRILDLYAEKYTNIITIHKENGGVSSARNRGIDLAKGKYTWFIDADDFIKHNCLIELKPYVNSNFDIINFGAYQFNESFSKEEQKLFNENKLKAGLTYWGFAWLHLYKTSIIQNNNIRFIKNIKYGEDEMFYIDMFEHSNNIANLKTAYYFYRTNPSSSMGSLSKYENKVRRINDIITSIIILKRNLETGIYKKNLSKILLQDRYKLLDGCLCQLNVFDAFSLIKKMQNEKIFDSENLSELNILTRRKIIFNYLKRRPGSLAKSITKKLLPDFLVTSIINRYYKNK